MPTAFDHASMTAPPLLFAGLRVKVLRTSFVLSRLRTGSPDPDRIGVAAIEIAGAVAFTASAFDCSAVLALLFPWLRPGMQRCLVLRQERILVATFGDEYARCKTAVRCWP